ncbi:hypothetical protein CC1G_15777 [Coprinopsis cinerea okayama7|uniref:Uncharacterized protein n=1 Tax=Coprinopsis cinerea (strain Okayama-7 / 130 / ATCC MYA-4618 / FGSC 9003) TaxID=240176 RepID=D6RR20_COPC7|nr:hypothetical protein CC1G_15777 [Coprinopsis cinerea okayama7\|eukprot:XP_002910057.1 hypothetical protein CC1G_15777 [Coprinopsis cinerea okayama7\
MSVLEPSRSIILATVEELGTTAYSYVTSRLPSRGTVNCNRERSACCPWVRNKLIRVGHMFFKSFIRTDSYHLEKVGINATEMKGKIMGVPLPKVVDLLEEAEKARIDATDVLPTRAADMARWFGALSADNGQWSSAAQDRVWRASHGSSAAEGRASVGMTARDWKKSQTDFQAYQSPALLGPINHLKIR